VSRSGASDMSTSPSTVERHVVFPARPPATTTCGGRSPAGVHLTTSSCGWGTDYTTVVTAVSTLGTSPPGDPRSRGCAPPHEARLAVRQRRFGARPGPSTLAPRGSAFGPRAAPQPARLLKLDTAACGPKGAQPCEFPSDDRVGNVSFTRRSDQRAVSSSPSCGVFIPSRPATCPWISCTATRRVPASVTAHGSGSA
jgi:predicted small lipoprotein YifL